MSKQRITGTFLMAPPQALKDLSPTRFMVYAALSLRADHKTGQCYPTWERIMDDTGMSRSAIHRNIQDLIGLGWVTKLSRGSNKTNRANRYEVHQAPVAHSPASGTKHSPASDTKHSPASDTLTDHRTNQLTDQPIGGLKGVVSDDIDFGDDIDIDIDFGEGEVEAMTKRPKDRKPDITYDYDF